MSEVWRSLLQRFVRLLPPLTESFLLVALPVQNYFIISVIYTFFFLDEPILYMNLKNKTQTSTRLAKSGPMVMIIKS